MPNSAYQDMPRTTPWTTEPSFILPAAIPATSTLFYPQQAVMRDANGNMIQCDDTQPGDFIGFLRQFATPTQVDPIDVVQSNGVFGDKQFYIEQPQDFKVLIAAAAAGQEGRKVFWLYNNQVQYGTGNNGNFAGEVVYVPDSTHVVVRPPWLTRPLPNRGNVTLPGNVNVVLTKFALNKSFQTPASLAQTIELPTVASTGSGDRITFIYTGATAQQVIIDGYTSERINGSLTYNMGTAQYSKLTLESDTTQWFVVG